MTTLFFNIHDIILLLTAGGSFVIALLLLVKQAPSYPNVFLAIFFLCISGNAIAPLFMWHVQLLTYGETYPKLLISLLLCASFLKGPALYWYVASICQPNMLPKSFEAKSAKALALHFGIPLLFIGILVAAGFRVSHIKLYHYETEAYLILIETLMRYIPWCYAILCLPFLRKTRRTLQSYYSDVSEAESNWLTLLIIGYVFLWSWSLVFQIFGVYITKFGAPSLPNIVGLSDNYIGFVLFCVLYSFSTSHTFHQLNNAVRLNHEKPSNEEGADKTQSEHQSTIPSQKQTLIQTILEGIETRELYLESHLNIERFSDKIDAKPKDVSYVINSHFNCNFFDFINGYRINRAKDILLQERDLNIQDVMKRSGFNSKSSFYRVFKQKTGVTPINYREKQLQHSTETAKCSAIESSQTN